MVAHSGISESSYSVKETCYSAKYTRKRSKTENLVNFTFTMDKCKSAGNIQIEHEPNTDEFRIEENLKPLEKLFDIKRRMRLNPTLGLFEE